ncbi:hypothetical protein Sme01_59620 [Sphaerisporangium melleum]|uniref:Uncharacterized protein n=1 Tax=Sphaerisporangium melleum TaxID=321316 RepID=A0A917RSK0_9ACTN|nr:hypothetical protein [Sphaerisporangium melleum]GGL20790.1 hypothetical protein GCM10007964_73420 [Sphaerisporangium melleum]GII73486.1 hypothetical protein Sme01_59620 [Sphaerisporangium melleum]
MPDGALMKSGRQPAGVTHLRYEQGAQSPNNAEGRFHLEEPAFQLVLPGRGGGI